MGEIRCEIRVAGFAEWTGAVGCMWSQIAENCEAMARAAAFDGRHAAAAEWAALAGLSRGVVACCAGP